MNDGFNLIAELDSARREVELIKSPQDLIGLVSKITSLGEKAVAGIDYFNNADGARALEEKIIALYDAIAVFVAKAPFSETRAFVTIIDVMKNTFLRGIDGKKEQFSEYCRNKSIEFRGRADYPQTRLYIQKALQVKPNDQRNWLEQGNLYFALGDFYQAISNYQIVLRIDPSDPNALYNIGLCYSSMSAYADSLPYFEESLKIAPNSVDALVAAGNSYFRIGRFQEAESKLNLALRLNPNDPNANLTMGALMHEYDYNIEKAKSYYLRTIELAPEEIIAKANLSEVLLSGSMDDCEQSAVLASKVQEEGPVYLGYPMLLIIVCSLYFRGLFNEATDRALNLVQYYETVHKDTPVNWKFNGLRKTIQNKPIDSSLQSLLVSFIDLVETEDIRYRNRLLKEFPERIRFIAETKQVTTSSRLVKKDGKEQEIIIKNTSRIDPEQEGYYYWEIFLTPQSALINVDKVIYTLHESYGSNRIQVITDRISGFKLSSKGWGEFQVKVAIHFKDKQQLIRYHWLKLR